MNECIEPFLLCYLKETTVFLNDFSWTNTLILAGKKPLVIAEGGFSGLFPHSSSAAYSWALQTSVPDVVLSCNVELTKDGVGVCLPTLKLQNATNIAFVYPSQYRGYNVNGKPMNGWFPLDYTYTDLRSLFGKIFHFLWLLCYKHV